jgi:hypothetical protein
MHSPALFVVRRGWMRGYSEAEYFFLGTRLLHCCRSLASNSRLRQGMPLQPLNCVASCCYSITPRACNQPMCRKPMPKEVREKQKTAVPEGSGLS